LRGVYSNIRGTILREEEKKSEEMGLIEEAIPLVMKNNQIEDVLADKSRKYSTVIH
jgi:hypothetical protein